MRVLSPPLTHPFAFVLHILPFSLLLGLLLFRRCLQWGGGATKNAVDLDANSLNQPECSSFFWLSEVYLLSNSFLSSSFPYLGVLLKLDPIFMFPFLRSRYSSCHNLPNIWWTLVYSIMRPL